MFSARGRNLGWALLLAAILAAVSGSVYLSWSPIAATDRVIHSVGEFERAVLVLAPGMAPVLLSGEGRAGEPMDGWGGALVNVRTGGGGSPVDAAATLSAGTRAFGLNDLITAGAADPVWASDAAGIFASWYGVEMPPAGAAVLDYPRLAAAQGRLNHTVRVGSLGTAFRHAGRATALLQGIPSGGGLVAAADDGGIVDHHGRAVTASVVTPGGWRTDWGQLALLYDRLPPGVGLVVIEGADLSLLGGWLPDPVLDSEVAIFAEGLVSFVSGVGDDAVILVLDPLPAEGGMGLMLAPGSPGRPLVSPTTRRPGIVSLQDVASTLLTAVGLPAEEGFGRPVGTAPAGDLNALTHLRRLEEALGEAGDLRAPLAQGMATGVVMVSILIMVSVLWVPRWYRPAAACLGGLSLLPLAAFLTPGPGGFLPHVSALFVTWAALLVIARCLTAALGFRRGVLALASAGLGLILADQLGGARWALLSPLGYSAAAGARYYGLGNEFLGVALGAAALVWAFGLEADRVEGPWPSVRWGDALRGAALLAATVIAASPGWGSNFGATVVFVLWLSGAAAHRLVAPAQRALRPELLPRLAAASALLAALGLAGVALWHGSVAPASSSHVGRLLAGGTGDALTQVTLRKIATGIRLFRYTVWTRVWLVILAVYAAVAFRPFGAVRQLFHSSPSLAAVSRLAVALSLAALLTNDSGVVTAALTVMAPIAVTLLALEQEVTGDETKGRED